MYNFWLLSLEPESRRIHRVCIEAKKEYACRREVLIIKESQVSEISQNIRYPPVMAVHGIQWQCKFLKLKHHVHPHRWRKT